MGNADAYDRIPTFAVCQELYEVPLSYISQQSNMLPASTIPLPGEKTSKEWSLDFPGVTQPTKQRTPGPVYSLGARTCFLLCGPVGVLEVTLCAAQHSSRHLSLQLAGGSGPSLSLPPCFR